MITRVSRGTLFFRKMHKKVKKWSKTGQKCLFWPVSDYFSKSYRPMSTISGRYIPKTSLICNIERIQPNHTSKRSKKVKNRSKMAFSMFFCPFQTISRRFCRRRRRNLGQYAPSLRKTFNWLKTYIKNVKKGQKQVTNGKFYVFASFRLFFGDFVAEGDEITGRRTVHHEWRFCLSKHT